VISFLVTKFPIKATLVFLTSATAQNKEFRGGRNGQRATDLNHLSLMSPALVGRNPQL